MPFKKKKTFFLLATLFCNYSYSGLTENNATPISQHTKNQSPAFILGMLVHRLWSQTPDQLRDSECLHNIPKNTLISAVPVTICIGKKGSIPTFTAPWRFIEPLQDENITILNALLTYDFNGSINLVPESGIKVQLEPETIGKINQFLSANKTLDHSANFIHFPTERQNMILTDAVKTEGGAYDFLGSARTMGYIEVPIQPYEHQDRQLYKEQKTFEDTMYAWIHTDGDKKLPPEEKFYGGHSVFILTTIDPPPKKIEEMKKRHFSKQEIEAVERHHPHVFNEDSGNPNVYGGKITSWVNTDLNRERIMKFIIKSEKEKEFEQNLQKIKSDFTTSDEIHKSIMNNPSEFAEKNNYSGEQIFKVYLATTESKYRAAIKELINSKKYPHTISELEQYIKKQISRHKSDHTPENYREEFSVYQPNLVKLMSQDELSEFSNQFKSLKDSFFNKENGIVYQGTGLKRKLNKQQKDQQKRKKMRDDLEKMQPRYNKTPLSDTKSSDGNAQLPNNGNFLSSSSLKASTKQTPTNQLPANNSVNKEQLENEKKERLKHSRLLNEKK